jgi:ubiquinone/menaquinone biosynthesis C-methylase UbiE
MEQVNECVICGGNNFVHLFQCKDYLLSNEIFSIEQCSSCGFRLTNPRPESNNLYKYYESENYISHVEKPDKFIDKVYNRVRKYTLKKKYDLVVKFKKGNSILDIGCGTGDFLHNFKANKWNSFGVEPNKNAREIAIRKNSINVYESAFLNDISEQQFDVITMWHVLEHVSDLPAQINLLKKILKKDGVLFVAIPNSDSPDAQMYRQYWAAYDLPRHLYHFTKKSVKELFAKFDFEVKEVLPMKFDAFYISMLSEKNKTGNSNYANAILNGLKSNLNATRNINHSSLTFVIKHKIG